MPETVSDNYKWIALSNTTLGVLMATLNASILLIALPDIFRGIHIDPLAPGNTNYLLWMMLSFLVVTAVLVLSIGLFFSLMIVGLAAHLPGALHDGLVSHGVPEADATRAADLPPVASLFAAFLGYNLISHLLGPDVLASLPHEQAAQLTGRSFSRR